VSANQRRLEAIEKALAQLLEKEKAYIVWHDRAETREEAIQVAIDAGRFNPETQEPVIIISHIPMRTTYDNNWGDEIPGASMKSDAEAIMEEMAPRLEAPYPDESPPEPKPEPRRRIHYPDMGIV
jgi:hypothetical protein